MPTTWTSDTCGCRLTFDDSEAQTNKMVHPWLRTERVCEHHADLSGQTLYETAMRENRRRSHVRYFAKTLFPQLTERDDSTFSFDDQRRLLIKFPLLTDAEKQTLQDASDLQVGPNLVLVS